MKRIYALFLALVGLTSESAHAQEFGSGLINQAAILPDFNRGHNVSVREQARPSYDVIGVPIGGVVLYPRVEAGAGATTNTYLTSQDATASPFLYQAASARVETRWSRHFLRVLASTTNREYLGQSQRNEHLWNVNALGRVDLGNSVKVEANLSSSRNFENLLSGEAVPTVAALSKYQYSIAALKTTYLEGRFRATAIADYNKLDFSTVPLRAGGQLDQNFRDRNIARATVQLEYAYSPSIALFGQITGSEIQYDSDPPLGREKLDSRSVRLLGGINVDIAGSWRGSIGVGYVVRDYASTTYDSIRGITAEFNIETFPTQRLTLGLSGQRVAEDISIGIPRPSFNNSLAVRTDYELLRNMIISAGGEYLRQSAGRETIRATASGRYLASRRINIQGTFSYTQRNSEDLREGRLEVSVAYQL